MALIPTRAKIQNTTPNAIEDAVQQEFEFIDDGNATWGQRKKLSNDATTLDLSQAHRSSEGGNVISNPPASE